MTNLTSRAEPKEHQPHGLLRFIALAEDALLVILLGVMILIATAQIFLRNFFDIGLVWGDQALRALVLWLGLIGAMVGSRENKHVNMEILTRSMPESLKTMSQILVGIFTVAVCTVLAYQAARFVHLDYQTGLVAFEPVKVWVLELILPIGFFLIAIRYLLYTIVQFRHCTTKEGAS